jgi:predicted esterase
VTEDGVVKILDFGLARSESETMIETVAPEEAGPGLTTPGVILGTLGYLSPEQARGRPASPASDVFSLGCVLYEMLTGVGPFRRETQTDSLSAVLTEDPPPLDIAEEHVLRELGKVAWKALEKDPDKRYATGAEFERALVEVEEQMAPPPLAVRSLAKLLKKPRVWVPTLIVLTVVGLVLGRWLQHQSKMRWARETAIPEIMRLVEIEDYLAAFNLANEAEKYIPSDPGFLGLWDEFSNRWTWNSEPTGATVSYIEYAELEGQWTVVGDTPLEDVRYPAGVYRWRIQMEGFETREYTFRIIPALEWDASNITWTDSLDPEGTVPEGMVAVDAQDNYTIPLTGFELDVKFDLPRFFIDRTEVTNREFQEFVEANGYERPEFWRQEFVKAERVLSFPEAMSEFRDATGRPGPSGFELGHYKDGEGDHPAGGVSWYEAAAYCEYRGKSLPTVYHWAAAALPPDEIGTPLTPWIIPLSNFKGKGPAPVGSYPAISTWGAYDMAGNVREWCLNEGGDGRHSLGGAWSDPIYLFTDAYPQSAWNRFPENGFRCVKYLEDQPDESLTAPAMVSPKSDFYGVPEVSDEVFRAVKDATYSYQTMPLNAVVESEGESPFGGREQWVSVDAAYGNERLPIRLHLPDGGEPPFQAVVWFPGMECIYEDSVRKSDEGYPLSFVTKSGRVLVQPVYAWTYERNDGSAVRRWQAPNGQEELYRLWHKDLGRTLDYLEDRTDIDGDRIAFCGFSLGVDVGGRYLAYDPRYRAAIFWSGGMYDYPDPDIVNSRVNCARRITIPVLMVNGRYDFIYPLETSQKPMLDLLGTPPEHKRHVVFDTAGHWPFPRAELIRESLDWLDTYLGPVKKAAQ